jgi:hypothetical protein
MPKPRGKQVATITEWLASLGLSEYPQRFAENDIEVAVLRHLTDQDLKEIGVSLGHCRKILASIAELAGAVPTKTQPAAPPEHARPLRLGACDKYVKSAEDARINTI